MAQNLRRPASIATTLIGLMAACTAAARPAYAPVKHPVQPITGRDSLPFLLPHPAYPQRGVLIALGGLFSQGATWFIVDLDAPSVTRIRTTLRRAPGTPANAEISSQTSRRLTPSETDDVIVRANAVWNPPPVPPAPPRMAMDVTCDVVLFDGEAVLRHAGTLCPDEALVQTVTALSPPALPPGR